MGQNGEDQMTKDEIQRLLKLDKELVLFVQRMRKVVEEIDARDGSPVYNRIRNIAIVLDKMTKYIFCLTITAGGISLVALGVSLYNLVGR
jgi:hypothetical protein